MRVSASVDVHVRACVRVCVWCVRAREPNLHPGDAGAEAQRGVLIVRVGTPRQPAVNEHNGTAPHARQQRVVIAKALVT